MVYLSRPRPISCEADWSGAIHGNTFADKFLPDFNEAELDEFARLLDVPDWEVYAWLIGQQDVPDNHKGPVLDQLIAFRYAPQAG